MNTLRRVLEFIRTEKLLKGGEKIIVAVSGGIDSMVMLDILIKLSKELKIKLHVAHLDHGLRETSERDSDFVRKTCEKWGIPFTIEKRKVRKRKGESLEEAARRVRYSFLRDVKNREEADLISTAHHLNDLAETMLYRLTRGTGPYGLVAIRPKTGDIIRPILVLTREEIEEYAESNIIPFVVDETNFDLKIPRNFIRHGILPLLKKLNPSVLRSFYKLSKIISLQESFFKNLLERTFTKYARKLKRGWEILMPEEPYLLSEFIRKACENLTGELPEWEKIELLLKNLDKTSMRIDLRKGVGIWKSFDRVFVGKLEAEKIQKKVETGMFEFGDFNILVSRDKIEGSVGLKYLESLVIRTRKPGDRIGKKKLKDFLIEKKIPAYLRDEIPVVANGKRVVWVCDMWLDRNYEGSDIFLKVINSPLKGGFEV